MLPFCISRHRKSDDVHRAGKERLAIRARQQEVRDSDQSRLGLSARSLGGWWAGEEWPIGLRHRSAADQASQAVWLDAEDRSDSRCLACARSSEGHSRRQLLAVEEMQAATGGNCAGRARRTPPHEPCAPKLAAKISKTSKSEKLSMLTRVLELVPIEQVLQGRHAAAPQT
jgi:hypothetical protein